MKLSSKEMLDLFHFQTLQFLFSNNDQIMILAGFIIKLYFYYCYYLKKTYSIMLI